MLLPLVVFLVAKKPALGGLYSVFSFCEALRSKDVANPQCMTVGDRLVVMPVPNCSTGDTQGPGKSCLRPE